MSLPLNFKRLKRPFYVDWQFPGVRGLSSQKLSSKLFVTFVAKKGKMVESDFRRKSVIFVESDFRRRNVTLVAKI